VRNEVTIKVGLRVGIGRMNERAQFIPQHDVLFATFASRPEAIGELRPGRACLRAVDYPQQRLKAAVRDSAGDKAVTIQTGPKLRLRTRCDSVRDDLIEIVIGLTDRDAALDLNAKSIALAGSLAVDDDIIHRLALTILLDCHTRHIPRLTESSFFSK